MTMDLSQLVSELVRIAQERGFGWQTPTDVESILYDNNAVLFTTRNESEEKRLRDKLEDEEDRSRRLENQIENLEDDLKAANRRLSAMMNTT